MVAYRPPCRAGRLERRSDKLYSVTSDFSGEGNVTYQYGGDQKRRSWVDAASETWYNWGIDWSVVSEEDDADGSSGALSRTYVNDPTVWTGVGQVLAQIDGSSPATGTAAYYGKDHIGSTRTLYSAAKAELATVEFTPYGTVLTSSGTLPSRLFTGQYWDDDAGLYYYPFRYLMPGTQHWISPEPFGIDGPNMYHYGFGSPVGGWDKYGLVWTWIGAGIGGVLGVIGGVAYGTIAQAWSWLTGHGWHWGEFLEDMVGGATVGAVAGGIAGAVFDALSLGVAIVSGAAGGAAVGFYRNPEPPTPMPPLPPAEFCAFLMAP